MEIKASNLQIGYGERVIVDDMSIHIKQNQITTIIGPNGSGKSTVLKAITRLIRYQQGNVVLDGRDILTLKPKELSRTIGVLPNCTQPLLISVSRNLSATAECLTRNCYQGRVMKIRRSSSGRWK